MAGDQSDDDEDAGAEEDFDDDASFASVDDLEGLSLSFISSSLF